MPSTPRPKHRAESSARPGSSRLATARQRGRHASSYGDGFGRFAGITTLSLVPGAGLVALGKRKIGLLLVLVAALGLGVLGVVALSGDVVDRALEVAVSPGRLLVLAVLAVLVGLVWCATILLTAWNARPERPSPFQGVAAVVLVVSLCAVVAAPSAKGAQLAMVQRDLVTSLFSDGSGAANGAAKPTKKKNPWKDIPRVNLLLLGSDAGKDRTGVRTDSMIVASINTKTGNTTLIGLPRNLQNVPFPESNPLHQVWPNGFNCGSECLLNAVWQQAEQHKDLFTGVKNPGLTTTRDVIGEVLGLRIDAYTIIDLNGFQSLVNAMGGVTVNVPRRIPIGGGHNLTTGAALPVTGYIEPGHRKLNGYQALWFSRSRSDSDDYDRMRRQRCMVGNLVDQANPVQLLSKYADLAHVLKNNIQTDIGQDQLSAWVILVKRMQKGTISSLPLTNAAINTVHPDFDAIRTYVKDSLNPPKPTSKPSSSSSPSSTGTSTPSGTASTPTIDPHKAQDIKEVC